MGHIEFVDGKPVEVERVDLSNLDTNEIYQELGINTPVQPQRKLAQSKTKIREPYIRTVPLQWAQQASQLPGKALNVGIMLWYLAGVTKSSTVTLKRSLLEKFGLTRETGRRALLALEKANLVRVERNGRKKPKVTLVEAPKPEVKGDGVKSGDEDRYEGYRKNREQNEISEHSLQLDLPLAADAMTATACEDSPSTDLPQESQSSPDIAILRPLGRTEVVMAAEKSPTPIPKGSEPLAELASNSIVLKANKKGKSGLRYSSKGPLPEHFRRAIKAGLVLLQGKEVEEKEKNG